MFRELLIVLVIMVTARLFIDCLALHEYYHGEYIIIFILLTLFCFIRYFWKSTN